MTIKASSIDGDEDARDPVTLSRPTAPNARVSPHALPVDPIGATIRSFSEAERAALHQHQHIPPAPITPHGPQAGVQSTMAMTPQPHYAQHMYTGPPPPPHALTHERRLTGPITRRTQPSSTRVIILVAMVLVVLCMLMAMILLARGAATVVR
jgi:hypothetical protein